MIVRKALIVACAAALSTTPAWAHPGQVPSNQGTAHNQGAKPDHPTPPAGKPSHPGAGSHRCTAHKVAYVAAGTLVSQTLVLDGSGGPTPSVATAALSPDAHGTYSGDVTVAVKRTNHHARADKGTTRTYTLDHAHVVFGLKDVNGDGSVGLDDLQPNARVKVIGKITVLAKCCDQTGFTPKLTIRQVVFHAPAKPAS